MHVHGQLVEQALVVHAVLRVAIDHHLAHRGPGGHSIGLRGEVVHILQERGGVPHHFLPEQRKAWMAAANSSSVGCPPADKRFRSSRPPRRARPLRRLERVGQVPQQRLVLPVPSPGQALVDRAAGPLLDDLALAAGSPAPNGRDFGMEREAPRPGSRRSPAAAPGAATSAAYPGRARPNEESYRSCRRRLAQVVRPSLRCGRPCRTGRAGNKASRDAHCRGA